MNLEIKRKGECKIPDTGRFNPMTPHNSKKKPQEESQHIWGLLKGYLSDAAHAGIMEGM